MYVIRTCMSNRCSVFLLDCQGQELVATVFDGAVQAKVSNYVYSSTYTCVYWKSLNASVVGVCSHTYTLHLDTSMYICWDTMQRWQSVVLFAQQVIIVHTVQMLTCWRTYELCFYRPKTNILECLYARMFYAMCSNRVLALRMHMCKSVESTLYFNTPSHSTCDCTFHTMF